jgi:hypothetical protein
MYGKDKRSIKEETIMTWQDILKRRSKPDAIRDATETIDVDEEDFYFGSDKVAAQDYRDEIKLLTEFKRNIDKITNLGRGADTKTATESAALRGEYTDAAQHYTTSMKRLKEGSSLITKKSRIAFNLMKKHMEEKMEYFETAGPRFRKAGKNYFAKTKFTGQNMPEGLSGAKDTINPKANR